MLSRAQDRPTPLALARMFLAVGAALTALEGAAVAHRLQGDVVSTPILDLMQMTTPSVVVAWFLLLVLASLGLLTGIFPRICAGVLASGNALLLLTDRQLYSNHALLLVLLCTCFAFARSDRAWAPGASRRREELGALVPWWPQLLVVASVSSCYLFAGLSKINPIFLSGTTLASLSPDWVPAHPLAWATPIVEVTVAVCLWSARARWVAIILGAGLHASIVALMGAPLVFGAFALLCMTAYPLAGSRPVVTGDGAPLRSAGRSDPAVERVTSRT